jgi:hypothetical protein
MWATVSTPAPTRLVQRNRVEPGIERRFTAKATEATVCNSERRSSDVFSVVSVLGEGCYVGE